MLYDPKWEVETKPENKWRTAFLKASAILEQTGWCQGTVRSATGEHCILGAIWLAHYGVEPTMAPLSIEKQKEWPQVWEILKETLGKGAADWNDEGGRTKDEVIAVLRSAAD